MLAIIHYIVLGIACTIVLILSAIMVVLLRPFDPARRCIHELSRVLTRIFFAWPKWRKIVRGTEKIDRKQPYVITINHTSMVDIPLGYLIPLNFRWVSKREVFRIPFFGQMLTLHGDICIDRSSSGAMSKVTTLGKKWLGRGASVAIFPEGTRSKDGEIHRFKSGAFTLAKEAGVPILPVVFHLPPTPMTRPTAMPSSDATVAISKVSSTTSTTSPTSAPPLYGPLPYCSTTPPRSHTTAMPPLTTIR